MYIYIYIYTHTHIIELSEEKVMRERECKNLLAFLILKNINLDII